jgi:hypothetical protein
LDLDFGVSNLILRIKCKVKDWGNWA